MSRKSIKVSWIKNCKRCKKIFTCSGKYCRICEDCKISTGGSIIGRPAGSRREWGFPK